MIAPLLPKSVAEQRDMFINTAKDATAKRLAREKDEVVRMAHGVGDQKRDIVGLMLRELKGGDKLTPEEITVNSILIVGGGAETTSSCMSGLWWHLLKTPRVYNHLRGLIRETFATNEDITIKACNNMPYLKATIDEALRIFPIASYITPRVTPKGGCVIAGEHVPEDVSSDSLPKTMLRFSRHISRWGSGTWAAQICSSTSPWNSDQNDGLKQANRNSRT